MKKSILVRIDDKTENNLKEVQDKLNISKSDIVRMAIEHFKNYVKKIN